LAKKNFATILSSFALFISRDYKNPQEEASLINEESENREKRDEVEDVDILLHHSVLCRDHPYVPGNARMF